MSTSIPFIPVEGAVALPSLRPLGAISESFGREWALLPPNVSLRIELKALYAAILRTFCLSSQAIRSMCKWEPHPARAVASAPVTAKGDAAAQAGGVAASCGVSAAGMRTVQPAMRASHGPSNLRLGSAVAIGGAAMLAWIVLDLPQRGHTNTLAPATHTPAPSRAAQIETPRVAAVASVNRSGNPVSHETRSTGVGKSDRDNVHAVDTSTVANVDSFASRPFAKASQPGSVAPAHAHATGSPAGSRATASTAHDDAPQATAASATASPLKIKVASREAAPVTPHHSKTATWTGRDAVALARSAVSRSAETNAKPSPAGEYSPPTPSALTSDDYGSVMMSARTYHVNSAATPGANATPTQRPQGNNVIANDTSWMNHMSQRRVTEVPELFSR
ncbi:hypothetical protein [Paraburkholderia humisilvae]|uniref:Uncharacterized protein n=1 Tax=Paraburkholderia humisilvae TaxID=627669 RepID=A0A6J5EJY8_9BURK|nr:hypothetical protein [Paraburkholderia humisilvae]CAB3765542.1 hypothetical protein LMG29542_05181 [Paraburkholderia humisilvae]